MALRELPPQVAIVCDRCRCEMDHEEVTLHYEAEQVPQALADAGWIERDGEHVCCSCAFDPSREETSRDGD